MSALTEEVRAFADRHVAPHAGVWERERRAPREALEAAARAGLGGLFVPEAHGGRGLDRVSVAAVYAQLARACMPFAFALSVQNNLASAIARRGGEAQRERWLGPMLEGRVIGAFCLTEPGAGSDAGAIAATASPTGGGGWRLDGEKAWISNATVADLFSVYATAEPGAGPRGIGCWIVERTAPGFTASDGYGLLGAHAIGTAAVELRGCRVGDEALLLGPGEGFAAAMAGIDLGRLSVAAMCCGMLAASLELAVAYTGERRAFGRPTFEFQGVSFALADVATDLRAAEALVAAAAAAMDGGVSGRVEAAHAKKFATGAARRGVAACVQAMGAEGLRERHPLGRHLAAAKVAELLDGTTEIQNVVIARELRRGAGTGPRA